ncbi:unnamed protein product [Periconia digitata]|uniref:1-alkyl-2-acetylglycerophosphocholine esterase n=1 Tax=Periconia digitata TaxID=1303443 RepID=A0A9W4XLB4_9PLEO|nr:unnamed protein product [Periconia digitata]
MLYLFTLLPLFIASKAEGYDLPTPAGKYNIKLTSGPLVDYSRDGWKSMISVFQPAHCKSVGTIPNMPNETAKILESYTKEYAGSFGNTTVDIDGLFQAARLPVCVGDASSITPVPDSPILLLSPGHGGSRLWFNVLASAIASEGFTVISMDHPGDCRVIEFPDGQLLEKSPLDGSLPPTDELVYLRGNDTTFVIDQLSNASAMAELGLSTFQSDRIAILGHSLGGCTALQVAAHDPRIVAAIDWAGPVVTDLPPSGIAQPVSFVSSENESNWTVDGMEVGWDLIHGPKLWTEIANLEHTGFLDMMNMLKAAGQDPAQFAEVLGTIDPDEQNKIHVAYTTEWLKGAFQGKIGGSLLEGEQPERFPEVRVVKKEGF